MSSYMRGRTHIYVEIGRLVCSKNTLFIWKITFLTEDVIILQTGTWFLFVGTAFYPPSPSNSEWN